MIFLVILLALHTFLTAIWSMIALEAWHKKSKSKMLSTACAIAFALCVVCDVIQLMTM